MDSKIVSDLLLEFETNPQQALQEFRKLDLYDRIRIRNEVREITEKYFDVRALCEEFLRSAVETHPKG